MFRGLLLRNPICSDQPFHDSDIKAYHYRRLQTDSNTCVRVCSSAATFYPENANRVQIESTSPGLLYKLSYVNLETDVVAM